MKNTTPHTFIAAMIVVGFVLGLTGCGGCAPSDSEQQELSLSPGEGLPSVDGNGRLDCAEPEDLTGVNPSLEAWSVASHANIIGTISEVNIVRSPVVKQSEGEPRSERRLVAEEMCDHQWNPYEIVLEDVEVLTGGIDVEDGGQIAVRIRTQEGGGRLFPTAREENGEVIFPYEEETVFAEGLRMGLSVNRLNENGEYYAVLLRMFEVFDGTVYLQEISERLVEEMDSISGCEVLANWEAYLPGEYHATPLETLREDIASMDADEQELLEGSDAVQRLVDQRDLWLEMTGDPQYFGFQPVCRDQLGP